MLAKIWAVLGVTLIVAARLALMTPVAAVGASAGSTNVVAADTNEPDGNNNDVDDGAVNDVDDGD